MQISTRSLYLQLRPQTMFQLLTCRIRSFSARAASKIARCWLRFSPGSSIASGTVSGRADFVGTNSFALGTGSACMARYLCKCNSSVQRLLRMGSEMQVRGTDPESCFLLTPFSCLLSKNFVQHLALHIEIAIANPAAKGQKHTTGNL